MSKFSEVSQAFLNLLYIYLQDATLVGCFCKFRPRSFRSLQTVRQGHGNVGWDSGQ